MSNLLHTEIQPYFISGCLFGLQASREEPASTRSMSLSQSPTQQEVLEGTDVLTKSNNDNSHHYPMAPLCPAYAQYFM